jgi:hypothetical protein
MYTRPIHVEALSGKRLSVLFEDDLRAVLDFSPMLERGGLFEALKDPAQFAQVRIDREAETLVWPCGADVCPDVLYHIAAGAPLPGPLPHPPAKLVRAERKPAPSAA